VGSSPFEDVEVDFTELPRTTGYKYLLVIVYILWMSRGFPHLNGEGPRSGLCFTKGNNSRYGIPISMGQTMDQLLGQKLLNNWQRN
jgi:hypothetical protein